MRSSRNEGLREDEGGADRCLSDAPGAPPSARGKAP